MPDKQWATFFPCVAVESGGRITVEWHGSLTDWDGDGFEQEAVNLIDRLIEGKTAAEGLRALAAWIDDHPAGEAT